MKKRIVTSALTVLAVTCLTATNVSAQNPFSIDGTISPTNNSGVAGTNASPPCVNPSPQGCQVEDPFGNGNKELGPDQGATTKVGVIHIDVPPTLALVPTTSKVDLRRVWLQSATAIDGDLWFYFGFERDANTGSGYNAIEFQQGALPTACVYTGIDPTSATSATALASCNPWANRQAGDFMIIFDAQGKDLTIYKRVFSGSPLVLGPTLPIPSGEVDFSSDGFRGEAAVNLTEDLFPQDGSCVNIANILPNTVTGNSDTADYNDTVLAHFEPIQNCGSLTVIKVTDVAEAGSFPYTADRTSGDPVRFPGDGGETELTGTLYRDLGPPLDEDLTDSHTELIAATDYTLTETVPTGWTFDKIVCKVNGGTESTIGNGGSFTIEQGKTTTCTIYNKLEKFSPDGATVPMAVAFLRDSMTVTGVRRGSTEGSATIRFRLYDSLNACDTDSTRTQTVGTGGLLLSETVTVTFADSTTTTTDTATTASPGYMVGAGTYYWWAEYSGNNLNNKKESACGVETTTVTFVHTPSVP